MEKQIVGFLNWVYPQIINSNRILDYKPSSYCGTPWLRNLHLHQLILCLAVPKGGKTHLKLPGIKKFKFIFHGRLDHGSFTWNGCSSPARAAHGFVKKNGFPPETCKKQPLLLATSKLDHLCGFNMFLVVQQQIPPNHPFMKKISTSLTPPSRLDHCLHASCHG